MAFLCPCSFSNLSASCVSCCICPGTDKGELHPILANVCLLVTLTSWSHLQNLLSSLFLSVFRRAPPGKCENKAMPVKTRSKRVQFRPLASESVFVSGSGLGIETEAQCPLQTHSSSPSLFPTEGCCSEERSSWPSLYICVHWMCIPGGTCFCGHLLSSIQLSFTRHCSLSVDFATVMVLIPGATAVNLDLSSRHSGKCRADR